MRIGLQVPSFTWPGGDASIGPTLVRIAQRAEEAGFYSFWVMDHFFQIRGVGQPEEPMLEAYTALGYVAAVTERIRLGTMVTGVIYRYPGVLIKAVTTLDVLSGGRAYFGVGAAWNDEEARGLGIPFPPLKERFEKLEDALQAAHQMWSGKVEAYDGKHAHFERTLNSPQAISQPHPPILVGGTGERKTLRLVAQYADACNLFARGDDYEANLRHKLEVLRQHCERMGRRYDDIEKTTLDTFDAESMTAQQVIDKCRTLASLGIGQAIFNMSDIASLRPLEIFQNEVIPTVSAF